MPTPSLDSSGMNYSNVTSLQPHWQPQRNRSSARAHIVSIAASASATRAPPSSRCVSLLLRSTSRGLQVPSARSIHINLYHSTPSSCSDRCIACVHVLIATCTREVRTVDTHFSKSNRRTTPRRSHTKQRAREVGVWRGRMTRREHIRQWKCASSQWYRPL
jgi:hypothetical protein